MKIVMISDTHGMHQSVDLPDGDLLIHAGDVCNTGSEAQARSFIEWFQSLDFVYKVFIAGNHDFYFEKADSAVIAQLISEDIFYLNDSIVEIEGIKIWGSPVQPWFYNWAFNRQRGADIRKHWDLIPEDIDILITHGPPHKILDKTTSGDYVGCEDLLTRIQKVRPNIHVFGHIHEAYGIKDIEGTKYINASVLNEQYQMINDPVVIET